MHCLIRADILRIALTLALVTWGASTAIAAEPSQTLILWPDGNPPGESRVDSEQPEQLVTSRRRTFKQYTNVAVPTLAVFLAPEAIRTGGAVLVCPGGGMQRLAYEHEGLEIADWLNPLGISVFLLKYRVPGPSATALLDAQRAMGMIRQRADEFKIDSARIGVMGFSAGGELGLLLSTKYEQRGYPKVDEADSLSCRPTHAALVYPGGIVSRRGELRPDIADNLDREKTPPMFIIHAFSDSSLNSFALGLELKRRRIPTEMHIYQEGGHGFGARDTGLPLGGWKASYVEWIRAQGFFDAPFVATYASQLAAGKLTGLQPMSLAHPTATLTDAYAVQRKVVQTRLNSDRRIGFSSQAVANNSNLPLTGVLFQNASHKSSEAGNSSHSVPAGDPFTIQTQLGLVVSNGLDISTHISTESQIQGAFESVIKVVTISADLPRQLNAELTEADWVATNLAMGAMTFADNGISPDDWSPANLQVSLAHDGKELHSNSGDPIPGGLWNHMISVVNQLVDQGYTLRSGDIVLSGPIGGSHAASPGTFLGDFGDLGSLRVEIRNIK